VELETLTQSVSQSVSQSTPCDVDLERWCTAGARVVVWRHHLRRLFRQPASRPACRLCWQHSVRIYSTQWLRPLLSYCPVIGLHCQHCKHYYIWAIPMHILT